MYEIHWVTSMADDTTFSDTDRLATERASACKVNYPQQSSRKKVGKQPVNRAVDNTHHMEKGHRQRPSSSDHPCRVSLDRLPQHSTRVWWQLTPAEQDVQRPRTTNSKTFTHRQQQPCSLVLSSLTNRLRHFRLLVQKITDFDQC